MNKEEQKFIEKNQPKSAGGIYYWITTVRNGKTIICGFRNSKEDAEAFAYEKNLEPYKIYPLRTRDINAASRMIRGNILNSSSNIDEAMQRFKRKL